MLFELDGCDEGVVEDEVAAGVEEVAGGLDDRLLEFDPQAAAASAASTSMTAVQARTDRVLIVCIIAPCLKQVGPERTAYVIDVCKNEFVPQAGDPVIASSRSRVRKPAIPRFQKLAILPPRHTRPGEEIPSPGVLRIGISLRAV